MKVLAPGKLILSGEHAVVYGYPALAMAVNRYAVAEIKTQNLPGVLFRLLNFSYQKQITFAALKQLKTSIQHNYQRFLRGELSIREVLQQPIELAQYALSAILELLQCNKLSGLEITLQSDIPVGCGMGSSAATVLSIMQAMLQHLSFEFSRESLWQLSLDAENMQHGHASGLDLHISLRGGAFYLHQDKVAQRSTANLPLFVVHTGVPQSSTGECVAFAAKFFHTSSIGKDFAAVTSAFDQALQVEQWHELPKIIQKNHELLSIIGVVPEKVQRFIAEINALEGAAKICGGGAVRGDNAGIVMVMMEDQEKFKKLCANYQYQCLEIMPECRGVHVI